MKSKLLLTLLVLLTFAALPALADDIGEPDTVDLVVTVQPDVNLGQLDLQLQLWAYIDADTINGCSMGFIWDNPKLSLTSTAAGPASSGAFANTILTYGTIEESNAAQRFQMVGIRLFTPGIHPSPTRQHLATYNFTLDDTWTTSDIIHIDTFTWDSGVKYKFVGAIGGDYFPIFTGPYDITDVNYSQATTIEVTTDTLEFTGQALGANPAPQSFDVTEGSGGNIAYNATSESTWFLLGNASGTTPASIEVAPNITGMGEGVYLDSVEVSSGEADNSPVYKYARLTLSAAAQLDITPDTLYFTAVDNGDNPASQSFNVAEASGGSISFNAAEIMGMDWISLTNASGTTPGDVEVNIDISPLDMGHHEGRIEVTSAAAGNSPDTVYIMLEINPQPALVSSVDTLFFNAIQGGSNPADQVFTISELNDGTIPYAASVTTGMDWINLTDPSGTTPGDITVGVDINNAVVGDQVGIIEVVSDTAANTPLLVYVKFTVAGEIALNVTGDTLEFNAVENGDNPAMQAFTVSEAGGREIAYEATFNTTNNTWMSLGNATGNTPADVEVNIDITNVMAGTYLDSIIVSSAEAANSPVYKFVRLTLAPQPMLAIEPDTLYFTAAEGEGNPAMQTFNVAEEYGGSIPYNAVVTQGDTWLSLGANASGTTPADVEVNVTNTTAGEYEGHIEVSSDTASNSPQIVYVMYSVTAPNTPAGTNVNVAVSDNINMTFDEVTGSGNTMVEMLSSGPEGPAGFLVLPESSPVYYDVTTTAEFSGSYEICFSYLDDILVGDESGLRLFHYEGDSWVDITTSHDPDGNIICGTASSLSFFVLAQTECLLIDVDPTEFNFTAVAGGDVTLPQTLSVASSNASFDIDYSIMFPISGDYSWLLLDGTTGNYTGTTPDEITLTVDPTNLTDGDYDVTLILNSSDPNLCETFAPIMVQVNLTVLPPPSADTVVVHNVGAIPGMQVSVPVTFSNSCPLNTIAAAIGWGTDYLHLDSVSFENSVLNYFDNHDVIINNETNVVSIFSEAGTQVNYPANSEQTWLELYFSVSCDADETTYPLTFSDDFPFEPPFNFPVSMSTDCGSGASVAVPFDSAGSIIVEMKEFDFCGWVVEEGTTNTIEGASVSLYDDFPTGTQMMTTTTGGIGSFAFENVMTLPFDLWVTKEGYYPKKIDDLNIDDKGVMIHLTPIDHFNFQTHPFYADYYCGDNTYYDAPLPVGSYVEAFDAGNQLVGQFFVTTEGSYGWMPVYRDDPETPDEDEGATPGDMIRFFVNGIEATATGDVTYPTITSVPPYEQIMVCLNVGQIITHSCDLTPGWNLISWNVNNSDTDIETFFGPYMDQIDVILGFEQGGLTYDPDLTQFSTLHFVDHLSGYWVYVKGDAGFTLEVTGSPVAPNTPINVTSGWNLVSYLPENPYTPDEALTSLNDNGNLLTALGFDGNLLVYKPGWQFSTLDEMTSCNGYWLRVTDDDLLVYPGNGNQVTMPLTNPNLRAGYAQPTPSNITPTTRWVNLYASNLTLDGQIVQAGATITARTAEGAVVGSFTMKENGQFGFMPVYAEDNISEAATGMTNGEAIYLEVNGTPVNETVTWTTHGDRIELNSLTAKSNSTELLPDSYSLLQNYPNPFNPTTTISFNMPYQANARLEIYDILGRLVAIPFDGTAGSGLNQVVWNGTNQTGEKVSSGIYFYRLSSEGFNETKKMMLLK